MGYVEGEPKTKVGRRKIALPGVVVVGALTIPQAFSILIPY